MIVEGVVKMLVTLVKGVLSLLPDSGPPAWFVNAGDQWSSLMGQVSSMSGWIPVSTGVTVVSAVLASAGIGFAIKVVRLVASYFTAGGGSAG